MLRTSYSSKIWIELKNLRTKQFRTLLFVLYRPIRDFWYLIFTEIKFPGVAKRPKKKISIVSNFIFVLKIDKIEMLRKMGRLCHDVQQFLHIRDLHLKQETIWKNLSNLLIVLQKFLSL